MEIIYKYIATDEADLNTSLSPCLVDYTLYSTSFVAIHSNFALWESNEF